LYSLHEIGFLSVSEKALSIPSPKKLETLRADLRATEEKLKSELRDKEAENLNAPDETFSVEAASRQALLDKRRFDAKWSGSGLLSTI